MSFGQGNLGDGVRAGGEVLHQLLDIFVVVLLDEARSEGLREQDPMVELGHFQRVRYPKADAIEGHFLDAVRDVLEMLHLGLPTCVNHAGDRVDGKAERVELLS